MPGSKDSASRCGKSSTTPTPTSPVCDVTADAALAEVLRPLVPQVLGALVRRHGQFEACEDAVQEALLAAAGGARLAAPGRGRAEGARPTPGAGLGAVATRRLTDLWRSESARRRREE